MTTRPPVEFRARFGRWLTIAVAVLCGASLLVTLVQDVGTALRYAPALLLPAIVVWALFTRPAVVVSDAGVEVRNVLRTIELPWPAIQRIDTRYALTLHTAYGDYAAWAAPAPGRMQVMNAGPEEVAHLPASTYGQGGGVRPGDLASSPSGQAAAYIRGRWEELRDAGHLDDPRLERERPVVRWHVLPLLGVAGLAALAAALTLG